jgi:N6-adenosine-specific RNA methylase IME4
MEYHEYANLFPMMNDVDLDELVKDMRVNGYDTTAPIITYQDRILDGRNRFKASQLAGVNPTFDTYDGDDPLTYVIRHNLHRRHLTESQRAVISSKMSTMERGGNGSNQFSKPANLQVSDNRFTANRPANLQVYTLPTMPNVGNGSEALPKISVPQAAEMMNVSERLVRTINAIERQAPELIERIERGEMTANEANREIKKAAVIEKTFKQAPEIPTGKFKVIYIDPPWQVGSMAMDKWESPIEDKYPTMSVDEIISLPIRDLADDECALFIWTTHTFLPDTFRIIREWGFKYFCTITWDKEGGWTQNGFHKRTEFLLYAYKGNMNINQYGKAIPTIIVEAKTKHSKKPDSIRDMIAEKTPEPRIEMFAREHFDGWTVWGNEV